MVFYLPLDSVVFSHGSSDDGCDSQVCHGEVHRTQRLRPPGLPFGRSSAQMWMNHSRVQLYNFSQE